MEHTTSPAEHHPAQGCLWGVQWGATPRAGAAAKRVVVLDPYEIECRLLGALVQAQGHDVVVSRDPDDFLAGIGEIPPHIAFVHACYEPVLGCAAETRALPPIVLVDSFNILRRGNVHLPVEFGAFPALRFPIGLTEIAEAIRLHAR